MLTRVKRGWELPESSITPEQTFLNRRQILKLSGGVGIGLAASGLLGNVATADTRDLYPVANNALFTAGDGRVLASEETITSYNNFYEFGTSKRIQRAAQRLTTEPWPIEIAGLCENPQTLDFDALARLMPMEERIYRLRCVEAWSMVIPWSGFALRHLVDMARPTSDAKYLVMKTFFRPEEARNQSGGFGWPWPYTEGLTLDEARNELAFIATGVYGKPIANQNGAPLRLAVPWKYGFKSIKSIVRFEFTAERPRTFWEEANGSEYGFWANVNPDVPHRRWSQASEQDIHTRQRHATQIYNGYGEWVADLYKDINPMERLFT